MFQVSTKHHFPAGHGPSVELVRDRFHLPSPVHWTAEVHQPALTQQARSQIVGCFHKAGF